MKKLSTCSHPPSPKKASKSSQVEPPDTTSSPGAAPSIPPMSNHEHSNNTRQNTFHDLNLTMKQQDYSTLNRNKEAQNENKTKNTNLNEDTSPTNFRDTLNFPQKQYTPMERLAKCRVSTETKNILIGDSVLTKINPKSCFDDPKTCEAIAISGMKIHDLLQWLRHTPTCNQVNKVIVHIGINTCKSEGVIGKEVWTNLITRIKSIFCRADIYFSSIIPPSQVRIQADLVDIVNQSNENLHASCKASKSSYIDNEPIFVTRKGLPKKSMYYDAIHPSTEGSYALSTNFRQNCITYSSQQSHPPNQPRNAAESSSYWRSHEGEHYDINLQSSTVHRTPTVGRQYQVPLYNTAVRNSQPALLESSSINNDLYQSNFRSPRADERHNIRTPSSQGQQVRIERYHHYPQKTGSRHDVHVSGWNERNRYRNYQQHTRPTWLYYNGPQHLMPTYTYQEQLAHTNCFN